MEVAIIMFLFLISVELFLIIQELIKKEKEKEEIEEAPKGRREVHGVFSDPLGDFYRKNKGLYVPVVPGSKMLEGSEDEE